jgi:peptide/nickel transport system permease protein
MNTGPAVPLSNGTAQASALRRFMRNPLGVASAVVLMLIVIAVVIVPLLGLPDPNVVNLREANLPPGSDHLLGTDASGRDSLSRLLWGGRINLLGACLALVVSLVVGLPSGLIAGYYGGWFDSVSNWVNNLNLALPGIVVLLAVRAVVGPSVWVAMGVFGVLLAPGVFRIVRAAVQSVRNELYIDAARVAGLSDSRIISRHILAVVRAPVIIHSARLAAIAIAIQAGLEFLGVSDNTSPSWGNMLNEGFRRISLNPALVLWPSIMIGLVSMSLVLLGNALRDALEDRGTEGMTAPHPRRRTPALALDTELQTDELLAVHGLEVSYGKPDDPTVVVNDVSFSVREGEVLGIVGESGSGKTQTVFAVLGLLPEAGCVSAGSVVFDGVDLERVSERERTRLRGEQIAYIPQEPMSNLDPSYRVGYQLTTPLRTRLGMSKKQAKHRSLELLTRVGIPDPEKTFASYPHEISGGMAQRVLIAGAVSCNPRLLIADEPTTALDVTVQAEVLDLLRDLQQEFGMAVVLVTHNFGVVADICDRVAVMQNGRLVETGDVRQVLASPQVEYTQTLLRAMLDGGPARPYPFDDEEAAR